VTTTNQNKLLTRQRHLYTISHLSAKFQNSTKSNMFETQHEDNEKFKAAQKELRKSNSEILKRNTDFLEGLGKKESQINDKNETTPKFDPSVTTNQVQDFNLEPEFDVMPLPGHPSLDPDESVARRQRDPFSLSACLNFLLTQGTILTENMVFMARSKLFQQQANVHIHHQERLTKDGHIHWAKFIDVQDKYSDVAIPLRGYKVRSGKEKRPRMLSPQVGLPASVLGQLNLLISNCKATKLHADTIGQLSQQRRDWKEFRDYNMYPDYPNVTAQTCDEFPTQSAQTYRLLLTVYRQYQISVFIVQIATAAPNSGHKPTFTYIMVDLRNDHRLLDYRQSQTLQFTEETLLQAQQRRNNFSELIDGRYNPVTAIFMIHAERQRAPNCKRKRETLLQGNRDRCPKCDDQYHNNQRTNGEDNASKTISCKLRCDHHLCLPCLVNLNFTIDVEPQCPTCEAPLSDEVDLGPAYEKQSAGSMQGIARQKEDYQILRDKQME